MIPLLLFPLNFAVFCVLNKFPYLMRWWGGVMCSSTSLNLERISVGGLLLLIQVSTRRNVHILTNKN